MVWERVEGFRRPAHGEMGGAKNVEAVDFFTAGGSNRPNETRFAGQSLVDGLAFGGADFFRIVQAGAGETVRKDDCRSCDRTGQWSSTGLIDAGDSLITASV